jgi:hypothetical protein
MPDRLSVADERGGAPGSVQSRDHRASEMALHSPGTRILEHCCEGCRHTQPRPGNFRASARRPVINSSETNARCAGTVRAIRPCPCHRTRQRLLIVTSKSTTMANWGTRRPSTSTNLLSCERTTIQPFSDVVTPNCTLRKLSVTQGSGFPRAQPDVQNLYRAANSCRG